MRMRLHYWASILATVAVWRMWIQPATVGEENPPKPIKISFAKIYFPLFAGIFKTSVADWNPIWIRFCIRMYVDPKHSEPNFLASAGAKTL